VVTVPERQQQHLVSKGYQKNFANDYQQVAVLDARSGATIDGGRHITSNWRAENFLTVATAAGHLDQSLEKKFQKTEGKVLDQIRRITPTRITDKQRRALDLLAAIHLVRSQSFVEMHGQFADAYFDAAVADLLAEPQLAEIFESAHGRQPAEGELKSVVAAQARKLRASPDLTANAMRRIGARVPEILGRYRVQLVEVPSWMPGFVLADQPVLHARPSEGRYGFASQLALGDADLIMMPIRRRLLACYTARLLPNLTLKTEDRGLRVINAALCRNAVKEIACHPDDAREISRVIRRVDQYPPSALHDGTFK
jgi:hypothetical protein